MSSKTHFIVLNDYLRMPEILINYIATSVQIRNLVKQGIITPPKRYYSRVYYLKSEIEANFINIFKIRPDNFKEEIIKNTPIKFENRIGLKPELIDLYQINKRVA